MRNQDRGKYLLKNTAIFTLGNMGTKLINFFMVPLYTYVLSTQEYGMIDLISTIGMVAAPILMMNINDGVMRFSMDKNADYNKIMSTGLCAFLFAILSGGIIFPLSKNFSELEDYGIYIYMYMIAYAANLLFLGYLRGKEKLLHFSVGNILNTFLIAILNIIFLVGFQWGIHGYFLAYTVANLATCVYAFVVGNVVAVIRGFNIDWKITKSITKYSVVLIPNSFMWWIINSSDRIMVSSMLGSAANGIYAVAYKIPSLLSTILSIFNTAWSYSAIKENESEDRDKYNNSIYDGLVMLTVIVGSGMMLVMKPFLKIYVEPSYFEAWKYTPFLVIGFVFLAISTFLGTYYTVYKDSKGFLYSSTFAAVINLILNFIFIPQLGVYGAALATCISYIAVFIYRAKDTKKYIYIKVLKKEHLMAYIILLLSGATMFIESIIGTIMLLTEFGIIIILFRTTWIPMLKTAYKKVACK